jgi:D-arabinose 1-dehydrogenase-like Zn-dependent alcohol dehydrogenase
MQVLANTNGRSEDPPPSWILLTTKKRFRILMLKPNKGLADMKQLFEEGKVVPIIDGPYKLSEVPEAFRRFGEGRHKGKVVISLDQPPARA